MIDTILPLAVLAALIFSAGMYLGSKRPVRREQRQLIETRSELAYVRSELSAVSPLKVRAQQLAANVKRLDWLATRRDELQNMIAKLNTDLHYLRYRQEQRLLSNTELATAPGQITHWCAERARLSDELVAVCAEYKALSQIVTEQSAALDADKEATMVALGLGLDYTERLAA